MPRVATDAPHGDTWVFRRDEGRNLMTFEIWDGFQYAPVYNNNGRPANFLKEVTDCRTLGQFKQLGARLYKAGEP